MLFGHKKKERVKVAKEMAMAENAFKRSEEKTTQLLEAFLKDFGKKHWRTEDV